MTFTDDLDAVRERAGIRRPARFRIKRLKPGESNGGWPWRVADAAREHAYGHAKTHAAAVKLVDMLAVLTPGSAATVVDPEPPAEVVAYITGGIGLDCRICGPGAGHTVWCPHA